MTAVLQDLRYGARLLLKHPGYSAISVVTLALGIGLTAMMFSLVYGALLRGLPFEDDHELMHLDPVVEGTTTETVPSEEDPNLFRKVERTFFKTDDAGRPRLKIRLHDWQLGGFAAVAERHGEHAPEVVEARKLAERFGQLLFDFAEGAA